MYEKGKKRKKKKKKKTRKGKRKWKGIILLWGYEDSRELNLPGGIWTVSFWLRPSLKSKNKKTTHTWRKHTQRTHCKLCVYFVFVTTGEKRKNVKVGHLAYQRTTLVVSTRPWVIPLDLSSFIVPVWSYKIKGKLWTTNDLACYYNATGRPCIQQLSSSAWMSWSSSKKKKEKQNCSWDHSGSTDYQCYLLYLLTMGGDAKHPEVLNYFPSCCPGVSDQN